MHCKAFESLSLKWFFSLTLRHLMTLAIYHNKTRKQNQNKNKNKKKKNTKILRLKPTILWALQFNQSFIIIFQILKKKNKKFKQEQTTAWGVWWAYINIQNVYEVIKSRSDSKISSSSVEQQKHPQTHIHNLYMHAYQYKVRSRFI